MAPTSSSSSATDADVGADSPDVPSDPSISDKLGVYLRNFALWARNGFAEQMRNNEALQGVMLRAYDTVPGTNPKIFTLQVNSAGTLSVKPTGLGGGNAIVGARSGIDLAFEEPIIIGGHTHGVRVFTADDTLNNAVPNGGLLRFDTVGIDTNGFAPTTSPFDSITIPAGLGGVYLLTGRSSGSGNQSTSLGMGILINSALGFRETNQTLWGPASINYTLDNDATQLLQLAAGDIIQLEEQQRIVRA